MFTVIEYPKDRLGARDNIGAHPAFLPYLCLYAI